MPRSITHAAAEAAEFDAHDGGLFATLVERPLLASLMLVTAAAAIVLLLGR